MKLQQESDENLNSNFTGICSYNTSNKSDSNHNVSQQHVVGFNFQYKSNQHSNFPSRGCYEKTIQYESHRNDINSIDSDSNEGKQELQHTPVHQKNKRSSKNRMIVIGEGLGRSGSAPGEV
mmetsp:Transcript_36156/g.41937  ORF Transcript_36156/g.41937 Transcript_36156/m.41937 type:complete len:121 (-) Transcript_36156:452-814(-)